MQRDAQTRSDKEENPAFCSATGKDGRDCLRRFGYALKGQTPQCSQVFRRGTRLSAIAAISTSGLVGYELHTGSVRGEEFHDFVRGTLIPNMNPYDGEADNSILVMDNCSIHHVEEIVELLQRAGFFYRRTVQTLIQLN